MSSLWPPFPTYLRYLFGSASMMGNRHVAGKIVRSRWSRVSAVVRPQIACRKPQFFHCSFTLWEAGVTRAEIWKPKSNKDTMVMLVKVAGQLQRFIPDLPDSFRIVISHKT